MNPLRKLAAIADAFEANELDDEARRYWGKDNEHVNMTATSEIILYSGRGGKTLLTLEDCFQARDYLKNLNKIVDDMWKH